MKEIIFTEEQLQNLDEIGKDLFNDEQDPRSLAYKRKLIRPKISLIKTLLLYILLPALAITAVLVLLNYIGLSETNIVIIVAAIYWRTFF